MNRTVLFGFIMIIILGFTLGAPEKTYMSSWWSVIYPEFYQQDIQLLPEEQRDRIEIRWRGQELWQDMQRSVHYGDIVFAVTETGAVFDLP